MTSTQCSAHKCTESGTDVFDMVVGSVPEGMELFPTEAIYCGPHAAQAMQTNAALLARGERPQRLWLRKVEDDPSVRLFPSPEQRETVLDALNVRALDRQMDKYGDGRGDAAADLYRKLTGDDPDEERSLP